MKLSFAAGLLIVLASQVSLAQQISLVCQVDGAGLSAELESKMNAKVQRGTLQAARDGYALMELQLTDLAIEVESAKTLKGTMNLAFDVDSSSIVAMQTDLASNPKEMVRSYVQEQRLFKNIEEKLLYANANPEDMRNIRTMARMAIAHVPAEKIELTSRDLLGKLLVGSRPEDREELIKTFEVPRNEVKSVLFAKETISGALIATSKSNGSIALRWGNIPFNCRK